MAILLTLLLLIVRSGTYIVLILLIRLGISIFVGIPNGPILASEMSLLAAQSCDVIFLLSFPFDVVALFIMIFGTLLMQRQYLLWGRIAEAPEWSSLIGAFWELLILIALFYLVRFTIRKIVSLGERNRQLDSAVTRLSEANLGFQDYAFSIMEQSVEKERNRITREIHDVVGYVLTTLRMSLEVAIDLVRDGPEELRELLTQSRDHAQNGLTESRQVLRDLRNFRVTGPKGLQALVKLVQAFSSATGISVQTAYGNAALSYGDRIDRVLFRIVQESMTNSFRHGKATEIRIQLWQQDRVLLLNIADNGIGCATIVEGIGFSGMKERLSKINGSVRYSGLNGFTLYVEIPLEE